MRTCYSLLLVSGAYCFDPTGLYTCFLAPDGHLANERRVRNDDFERRRCPISWIFSTTLSGWRSGTWKDTRTGLNRTPKLATRIAGLKPIVTDISRRFHSTISSFSGIRHVLIWLFSWPKQHRSSDMTQITLDYITNHQHSVE